MNYQQKLSIFSRTTKEAAEMAERLKGFSDDGYNKLSVLHADNKQLRLLLKDKLEYALKMLKQIDEQDFSQNP